MFIMGRVFIENMNKIKSVLKSIWIFCKFLFGPQKVKRLPNNE